MFEDRHQYSENRVTYLDREIPIKRLKNGVDNKSTEHVFRLVAHVSSPIHMGDTLQATHVDVSENNALVSYNLVGTPWKGAIDVFDISDPKLPVLLQTLMFPESDVNAVLLQGDTLYWVGASGTFEEKGMKSPALMSQARFFGLVDTIHFHTDVPSYSANALHVSDRVRITSGSDGGLFSGDVLVSVPDARSLVRYDDISYVLSGDGNLYVCDDHTVLTTHTVSGTLQPWAKSQMDNSDDLLCLALNDRGIQTMKTDGTLIQHFERPGPEPDDVTNSLSFNEHMLFVAQGASGLQLFMNDGDSLFFDGTFTFEDRTSANYVLSRDDHVFVASGMEGLKILTIERRPTDTIIETVPCESLLGDIWDEFPENKDVRNMHSDLFFDTTMRNVLVKEETHVYVTFLHEGAGYTNEFGYYTYTEGEKPDVTTLKKHVIFDNASMEGSGGTLKHGYMVRISEEPFKAGTVIGFYLHADKKLHTHYTDNLYNLNSQVQSVLFVSKGCNEVVLAFEDMRVDVDADNDFNDIMVSITDDNIDSTKNESFKLQNIPVK
jgi:hypothetical protein